MAPVNNTRTIVTHLISAMLLAALAVLSGLAHAGPGKTLYLHGPVTIVTPVKNPNQYGEAVVFYHNDILGSPIATTDINGNLCWSEDYYPYGEKRLQEDGGNTDCGLSGSGNERGYTNHVFDSDINLTYAQARYYDQTIGRFYGMDPVGVDLDQPAMFNRYAYGNNNPYKFVDPYGTEPEGSESEGHSLGDLGVSGSPSFAGYGDLYSSFHPDFLEDFAENYPVEHALFKEYATKIPNLDDFRHFEKSWREFDPYARQEVLGLIARGISDLQNSIYGPENIVDKAIATVSILGEVLGLASTANSISNIQHNPNLTTEAMTIAIHGPQLIDRALFNEAFGQDYRDDLKTSGYISD